MDGNGNPFLLLLRCTTPGTFQRRIACTARVTPKPHSIMNMPPLKLSYHYCKSLHSMTDLFICTVVPCLVRFRAGLSIYCEFSSKHWTRLLFHSSREERGFVVWYKRDKSQLVIPSWSLGVIKSLMSFFHWTLNNHHLWSSLVLL